MSTRTQVIIHSAVLSLIDDRSVLMFKVCRWESPTVSQCRQERVGSGVDSLVSRQPPQLARHHTHALRSQAELSCLDTDLPPTVEEPVQRYESAFFKIKE